MRRPSSPPEADDFTARGLGARRRARDVYGRVGLALLALALMGLALSACGGGGHASADAATSSTATTGATTGGEGRGTSTVDPKSGSGGGGTAGASRQSTGSAADAGGSGAAPTGTAGTGSGGGSGAGKSSKDSTGAHDGGRSGTGGRKKDVSSSHGSKGAGGSSTAPAAVTGSGTGGGGSTEPNAAQPTYEVRSLNMEPTYKPYVKLHYNPSETAPAVSQVVVFRLPVAAIEGSCGDNPPPGHACQEATSELSSTLDLGRVVAVGGDSVAFQEGNAILNGSLQAESSFTNPCGSGPVCNFSSPITVPAGNYYILYDNRSQVNDSRVWGAVPQAAIVGVVDGVVSSS